VELAIAMRRRSASPIVLNLKTRMPYGTDLEHSEVACLTGIAPQRLDLLGAVKLTRALRASRPDVLLINGNRQAMVLGALATRMCRVPVVLIHTHEHLGRSACTMRFLALTADGIVAAADSHREYLRKLLRVSANRIARVYPGINFDRTISTSPQDLRLGDKPTVGIVAALRPEKDHETFLRAASLVSAEMPTTRFAVIGDGPRRSELQQLAIRLGLTAQISFRGWQQVNTGLLRELSILALSSRSETLPAVIIEAFSAGIPVVATDVGSVRELMGTPPCGILVPPGDPAALAQGLLTLLRNPEMAMAAGAAGSRRGLYFSADRFAGEILQLCRLIVREKAQVRRPDISRLLQEARSKGAE
jgi:glycosyltransferase involved in cell wall biosynthesis